MAVSTTKKAGRKLPVARLVKKADRTKAITPNEARQKRTRERLKGSPFASDNLD